MSRSTSPRPCQTAGFTLIEALAALTVMATSMAAIGALANSSLRSGLYVERHVAHVETARKIVTGLPSRGDLAPGTLTGTLDSHQWRIVSEPFANTLSPPGPPPAWEPQLLALRVLAPGGAVIEIDTVRLRRRGGR